MRTGLLILALLSTTPTLARSRPQLRHKHGLPARPVTVPGPNLAQVYANGTTHGLVFKTVGALALYWNDTVSVGQPIGLQTYLDEGAAVLVPNGTRLEILSPSVQSIQGTAARYVRVRMRSGYWKDKYGYILWNQVAALPPKPKHPFTSRK